MGTKTPAQAVDTMTTAILLNIAARCTWKENQAFQSDASDYATKAAEWAEASRNFAELADASLEDD